MKNYLPLPRRLPVLLLKKTQHFVFLFLLSLSPAIIGQVKIADTNSCPIVLSGCLLDELGQPAPNVHLNILITGHSSNLAIVADGLYSKCLDEVKSGCRVEPIAENNDWLNGVTTFDMLLIGRHIMGLGQLDSPYKMIAADVDHSGIVTAMDITAIRKLILGFRSSFPNNDSWRYIKSDFEFPDPTAPFSTAFPETWAGSPPNATIDFIAVKIGDVNNTHTDESGESMPRIDALPIGIGNAAQRAAEYVTIPLSYEGREAMAAIQLGLQFDAAQWELLEPSTAGLYEFNLGCFNLAEADAGKIKFVWFTPLPKKQIRQGQVLFYLTFRRKSGQTDAPLALHTDDTVLDNAGFMDTGSAYQLRSTVLDEARTHLAPAPVLKWSATCSPNPVSDVATLRIESPDQQAMSVLPLAVVR